MSKDQPTERLGTDRRERAKAADSLSPTVHQHKVHGGPTRGPGIDRDALASAIGDIGQQRHRALPCELGRYTLIEVLGEGGMGVVYRAEQADLGRQVALKVLRDSELAAPGARERFLREARSAARLTHPGIVAVHDVGEADGTLFFTQELIDGRSLDDVLLDGTPPPLRAAELVRDIARAIHHAHEEGVVHRDIKPGNVLIDREGRARVTDFGLAKELQSTEGLTRSGEIFGTPAYMPPEQALGQLDRIDGRSDVYALGALLYHLLTGRTPFASEALVTILTRIVEDDPTPPRQLKPSLPRDLETVCLKAMHKQSERRYQTAAAMADDLERVLAGEPVRARRVGLLERLGRRLARHRALVAVSALAVVAVIVGTTMWAGERTERQRVDVEARDARVGRTVDQALTAMDRGDLERAVRLFEEALDADPTRADARRGKQKAAAALVRLRKAEAEIARVREAQSARMTVLTDEEKAALVAAWDVVIELQPHRGDAYGERALVIIQMKGEKLSRALVDIDAATKRGAHRATGTLMAMALHEELRNHLEIAAKRFTAVSREASDPWRRTLAAVKANQLLRKLHRYEEALSVLRPLAGSRLGDVDNGIAITLQGLKRYEEAVAVYRRVLDRDPTHLAARANLASLLLSLKRHAEALDEARLLCRHHPEEPASYRVLGQTLRRIGKPADALRAFTKLLKLDPQDVSAWVERIQLLEQLGQREHALGALDKLLNAWPDSVPLLQQSVGLKERMGLLAEAEADLRVLLRLQPSGKNTAGLAMLLFRQGKQQLALSTLRDNLSRAHRPEDLVPLLTNQASILYQLKSYAAASAAYQRLARFQPGVGFFGCGLVAQASGDLEGAERYFGRSVDAGYVRAYYSRGLTRMKLGRKDGARADFEATLAKDRDGRRRAMAKKALGQLGG